MKNQIVIYTTKTCPFCIQAKDILDTQGLQYQEISVDQNPELRQKMAEKAGKTSVPQIWIGDIHVGGCDDLIVAKNNGKLDSWLKT